MNLKKNLIKDRLRDFEHVLFPVIRIESESSYGFEILKNKFGHSRTFSDTLVLIFSGLQHVSCLTGIQNRCLFQLFLPRIFNAINTSI